MFKNLLVALLTLVPSLVFAAPFGPNTIADVAEEVSPSVVNIAVSNRPSNDEAAGPRKWQRWRPKRQEGGEGSGFFLDREGRILTNHHVVEGGTHFDVTPL